MGLGIPPLKIKILLESNPLKSSVLVRRLAVSSRLAVPRTAQHSRCIDAWARGRDDAHPARACLGWGRASTLVLEPPASNGDWRSKIRHQAEVHIDRSVAVFLTFHPHVACVRASARPLLRGCRAVAVPVGWLGPRSRDAPCFEASGNGGERSVFTLISFVL